MGRYLLLFLLIIAAYLKLDARQPEHKKEELKITEKQKGTTTIYLVRHAEKNTSDANDQDPDLTAAGLKRANDLKAYLNGITIDAFFSTPYKRNQKTLAPLAQGRPIQFYEAQDYEKLRQRILNEFRGKTILIVGHSNTLLPMIEALGGKKPVEQILDDQYDNIFRIKINAKDKAVVQADKFGAPRS